jgi:hypothetical protein
MKAKHHRTVVVFSGQVTEISQDGVQDVKENFFTQTFVADTNFVAPEAENKEPDISPRDGKKHKRHRTNDDADEISDSEFQALSSYILPTPPRASMKPSNSNPNSLQSSMDSITNNTATTNNTNNNASNGSQSSPVTPRRKLDSSSRNSSSENLMANVSPNGGNSPPVAPRRKLEIARGIIVTVARNPSHRRTLVGNLRQSRQDENSVPVVYIRIWPITIMSSSRSTKKL